MLMPIDFRVRQREFLLEISRAITAQLDLSEVLRRVLNASVIMLAGQSGLVALKEASGDNYRVRALMGIDTDTLPELNQRLNRLIEAVSADASYELFDARLRQMARVVDGNLKQSFALPLVFAGETLGLLIVFREQMSAATPDDVQVLQSFADQAAIAVHNAQMYERIDQERKRLTAILQHGADGVMILNADLTIARFNRALERMTGWRAQDAIGRPHDEVITWKRLDAGGDLQAWVANGGMTPPGAAEDTPEHADGALNGGVGAVDDAPEPYYAEGDLLRVDGLTQSLAILYTPLHTADGHLVSIIANVRDIANFRRAQEMQSVFISTISHELKTPVTLIKGYAATLGRDDVEWDDATVREYSTVIEEEADRLTGLIENLLAASKIQAERRLDINMGDAQLDQIASRAVERFQTQTTAHRFRLKFPQPFPPVPGDDVRLRQVIDNLLSNAVKYSPEGGTIEVGGFVDDHNATVYVKDPGIGLTPAQQERIFERFYRADSALSRKTQGTGLGLYLSRAIIEAHGGTMRVESQPGHGSTFFFTLPLQ